MVGEDHFRVDLEQLDAAITTMVQFGEQVEDLLAEVDRHVADLHLSWSSQAATSQRAAHHKWVAGVEEMRENDITVGVDCSDWRRPEVRESRILYHLILGGLLLFFLTSLQWGGAAPEPWSLVLKILGVGALPAMFWTISKIG